MGQAIHYCYRCSTQLRHSHFEQGKAYRIDSRVCCAACAPDAVRSLPPDLVQLLLSQIAAKEKRSSSARPPASRPASPPPSRISSLQFKLLIGAAVAVLCGVVATVVLLSGGSATPPSDRALSSEKPAVAPQGGPQRIALKKAQDYARAHPDDLFGQLQAYEDLTLLGDKGEAGAEARKAAQALRVRGKDAIERGLASLQSEIAGALGREAFGTALDFLEAARGRMGWPEWKLALDKVTRDLQDRIQALYGPLKTKAAEAKEKGNVTEMNSVVARVQGWGVARFSRDLNEALSKVSAPPTRVLIDDGEKDSAAALRYIGGEEFPGARGSLNPDRSVAHGGTCSYKLHGDFSGGGVYVGFWFDIIELKNRDFKEVRLWVKTSTVARVDVRFADDSGQMHQKSGGILLARTDEWQELVLRVQDVVGGQHWDGANDGKWHGSPKGFGLNISKEGFVAPGSPQGTLWIDDVEGVPAFPKRDQ